MFNDNKYYHCLSRRKSTHFPHVHLQTQDVPRAQIISMQEVMARVGSWFQFPRTTSPIGQGECDHDPTMMHTTKNACEMILSMLIKRKLGI